MRIRNLSIESPARPESPRIGLVVPATDQVSEAAFAEMLSGHPVSVVVSRVAFENPVVMATLSRMVDDLARATALLLPGRPHRRGGLLLHLGHGGRGRGPGRARHRVGEAWCPVHHAHHGGRGRLPRLGVRRIAVLTPYVDEVNEAICGFLTAAGLDVLEFGSFHLRTEPEIAAVPPDAIVAAGRAIAAPGAEALFISCTGLQGHAAIGALEAATGKPVVTSNQAQLWEALSLIGYRRPLSGYGRLLDGPVPARVA